MPVSTGPTPVFEFAGDMSDGEKYESRPPRTPERWEALTDEEDRVKENMGNEKSYFLCIFRLRRCKENKIPHTNLFVTDGRLTKVGK
jgi:hypothetical protein